MPMHMPPPPPLLGIPLRILSRRRQVRPMSKEARHVELWGP